MEKVGGNKASVIFVRVWLETVAVQYYYIEYWRYKNIAVQCYKALAAFAYTVAIEVTSQNGNRFLTGFF